MGRSLLHDALGGLLSRCRSRRNWRVDCGGLLGGTLRLGRGSLRRRQRSLDLDDCCGGGYRLGDVCSLLATAGRLGWLGLHERRAAHARHREVDRALFGHKLVHHQRDGLTELHELAGTPRSGIRHQPKGYVANHVAHLHVGAMR